MFTNSKTHLTYRAKRLHRCGVMIVVMLLVTLMGDGLFAQNPNDQLRWRFKPGERFDVSLIKTGNVETQVDTRIRKVEIESQLEFQWNVIKVAKRETTIEPKTDESCLRVWFAGQCFRPTAIL